MKTGKGHEKPEVLKMVDAGVGGSFMGVNPGEMSLSCMLNISTLGEGVLLYVIPHFKKFLFF